MSKMYKGDRNLLIGFIVFVALFAGLLIYLQIGANQDQSTPGIADFKRGSYKVAIQKLSGYLTQHPCSAKRTMFMGRSAVAQRYLGLAYLNDHQYQKAVDALRSPCLGSSKDVYFIGTALMKEGNLQDARAEFTKSIDMEAGTGKAENYTLIHQAHEKIDELDNRR